MSLLGFKFRWRPLIDSDYCYDCGHTSRKLQLPFRIWRPKPRTEWDGKEVQIRWITPGLIEHLSERYSSENLLKYIGGSIEWVKDDVWNTRREQPLENHIDGD